MRSITVKDLDRVRRARLLETERAKRMQSVFVKTEELTDVALDAARQNRATRRVGRGKRSFPIALGLGLTLATGGALAYGAQELPQFTAWVSAWVKSEKPAPRRVPVSEAHLAKTTPEVRGITAPTLPARPSKLTTPPSKLTTPLGRTPEGSGGSKPQASNQPRAVVAENIAPAPAEGWARLADALSREQLHEAEAEAALLSIQGTPEEREAAQLVAVQIQLKRDGVLSSVSRVRLEELVRRGVSENSRREAVRLLRDHP